MFYKLVRLLCKIFYGIFCSTEVIGLENVPKEGACIISPNHVSNWDPPFVGSYAGRVVCFMAKEELFRNPILGAVIRGVHGFPVKRGTADKTAIKNALKVLKDGGCLGIFPEGTRSKTGKLGKAESGVSVIAAMAKVPVIPAAVINTEKIFSAEVKFPRLLLVIGKPMNFNGSIKDKDALSNFAQDIMNEIAKLKIYGENLTK